MDKAIIESRVATIPRSELGEVQANHEIISLSISGEPSERQRVMREFKSILGVPESL